ncbi:MAG: DUF1365 domain-containing protein [Candidatus Obscuribacter sp.]|nr:DUF1365 domain-containing protein [Candidatus Obscuribacter sp.]
MSDLSSAIYQCRVRHTRYKPKQHSFAYGVYMLYLDLAELAQLDLSSKLFSHNSFNLFSFYDSDHLKGFGTGSLLERFDQLLKSRRIDETVTSVRLLTYPRILGYVFNPVSFYFGFDKDDSPVVGIAEVGNTFGEMKVYILEKTKEGHFRLIVPKEFYVSPYGKLLDLFDFVVPVPGPDLKICVDTLDCDDRSKVLVSSISGQCLAFDDRRLFKLFWRYPLVTLKVISMIHWQAFLLYLKGVPYFKKQEAIESQTEILNVPQVRYKV